MDLASCDPSVGLGGMTPIEDYQQLYAHGQNRQTPYQSYFSQCSALGGSGRYDSMDSPLSLHTTVRQNAVEIHWLIKRVNIQEESTQEVKKMNELLTSHIKTLEEVLEQSKTQPVETSKQKKVKDGSNDHPVLKPLFTQCLENYVVLT
ncbi:hypothetical protein J3R83DRAFT_3147 [Lanmaoa asiatica]|nr:hypothetical protein J3R83DRAFT_3147 [Lanmaoa asiatica]